MKPNFLILIATILLWVGLVPAARADSDETASQRPGNSYIVPLSSDRSFSDVHVQLQALVNTLGFREVNHFCIIAYGSSDDPVVVPYVYWPTQNKFIVWFGPTRVLLGVLNYFDLSSLPDHVPPGSNYLTRSGANFFIHDCAAHGKRYTIKKTIGGWVPIKNFSQFASVKSQLQFLADDSGKKKKNTFCVIGQKDDTFLAAYVYWITENQLILWLPQPSDDEANFAVEDSYFAIDLKHDLRDEENSKNDRDEMQRSYADSITNACKRSGQIFVTTKTPNFKPQDHY